MGKELVTRRVEQQPAACRAGDILLAGGKNKTKVQWKARTNCPLYLNVIQLMTVQN
jgi:hypothetical protein